MKTVETKAGAAMAALCFLAGSFAHAEGPCPAGTYLGNEEGNLLSDLGTTLAEVADEGGKTACFKAGADGAVVRHGPQIQWLSRGVKKDETRFVNDEEVGPVIGYFESGKVEFTTQLGRGGKPATVTYFDEKGKKVSEGAAEFEDGMRKIGTWRYWINGKLVVETEKQRNLAAAAEQAKQEQEEQKKADAARKQKEANLFCHCVNAIRFYQRQKQGELDVGEQSGFVNKQKLHSLGSMIVNTQRFLKAKFPSQDSKSCPEEKKDLESVMGYTQHCDENLTDFLMHQT